MAFPSADVYTQPYEEALRERMCWFSESSQRISQENEGDSDEDDDEVHPQAVTKADRVLTLRCDSGRLVVSSLSASEVLRCALPEVLAVLPLRVQLAEALSVQVQTIECFAGGRAMEDSEVISDVEAVLVKQLFVRTTVFVCQRTSAALCFPSLGEGGIRVSFPQTPLVQAMQEPLRYVTGDSDECWLVYWKERVQACRYSTRGSQVALVPVGTFPSPPAWPLPPGTRRWGDRCDVWSTSAHIATKLLDKHAAHTNDRPIPRYQMVVDPNQFIAEGDRHFAYEGGFGGPTWVACEADVDAHGSVHLVGGERSHAHPELAREVAAPVLEAALPLLAQLERPRLLLDRRRLQFVFKAQRIIVPPSGGDGSDAEYVGLWHVDGLTEPVVAVALFYYRVHPCLRGGDMEFCGREPLDVLGFGDCSNNNSKLDAARLRLALRATPDHAARACKVPIEQGTLLVFSNYQMAHRVLRMVNTSADEEASRDFVALFIIDPAAKPLLPARLHLASTYMASRTLRGALGTATVQVVLEFLGDLPSQAHKRRRRAELLREQLRPQGQFVGSSRVTATGNGCFTMIGWLDSMLEAEAREGRQHSALFEDMNPEGWQRFRALNLPPRELGRGMSEVLSLDAASLASRRDPAEAIDALAITGGD